MRRSAKKRSRSTAAMTTPQYRYDEWDALLDRGKVKKVKEKPAKEDFLKSATSNPFQAHAAKKAKRPRFRR